MSTATERFVGQGNVRLGQKAKTPKTNQHDWSARGSSGDNPACFHRIWGGREQDPRHRYLVQQIKQWDVHWTCWMMASFADEDPANLVHKQAELAAGQEGRNTACNCITSCLWTSMTSLARSSVEAF